MQQRYKKKLESEADLTEEQIEQYRVMMLDYQENIEPYISQYLERSLESGRTKLVLADTTSTSDELVQALLKDALLPKVILVNHEKRLPVDAVCANLALKYNMMYLSVYQLIRKEILDGTSLGHKLLATKKTKAIDLGPYHGKDEYGEEEYSAAHFDLDLVIELIRGKIQAHRRYYQTSIMIEGLCNSNRLTEEEHKLELRFMDELFMIEKHIGEVQAIVGLQY